MSGIRGIGDGRAVQRLLWLVVGTVIVPTILLALYGITAIQGQHEALEKQIRSEREAKLVFVARALFDDVSRAEDALRAAVATCAPADPACPALVPGVSAAAQWPAGSAAPLAWAAELAGAVPVGATTWISPSDGGAPVGTFRAGDQNVAFRLDIPALTASAHARAVARYPDLVFSLEAPRPGPAVPIDELVARWQSPIGGDLPLERPFAEWRLALLDPRQDPSVFDLGWTRSAYVAGLFGLVGLVVVGAFITLSSASREIRLSRLQSDFVSNVSHELRTPLTAIRMFVETLQSGRLRDADKIQECLTLLSRETDRLSRRIERVLDLAKMEAGKRVYEFEPVPAGDLVLEALEALRSHHLLEDAGAIAVELDAGLPPVRADRDAIVEALVNLLQNAVRYTPVPRRIRVAASRDGDRIGISVSDNGPGIAKRHRRRIFEKFYQADTLLSSTAPGETRGSGLGLSIVRAVARGHGGRVDLVSEVGSGSRFTLWLPIAEVPG